MAHSSEVVADESDRIDCGFRLDLLVEDAVIIELKAVEKVIPLYDAQLISYLKLTGCHPGLLLNFNVPVLTEGLKRIVRNFPD